MHLESATQQWQWESKWGEARIIALS